MRALFTTIAAALTMTMATLALAANALSISVPDMECENCSQALIRNFEKDASVAKADADIENRILIVTLRDGKTLENGKAEQIVRDSGFTPAKISTGKAPK